MLQAKAALEAAALQADTARKLVLATWVLVGVTALLATAAVVALFLA